MSVYSCPCRARQGIPLPETSQCPGGTDGNIISQKEEPPGSAPGAFSSGLALPAAIFSFRVSAEVRAWEAGPSACPSPDRRGHSGEARSEGGDCRDRLSEGHNGREDGRGVQEGPTCVREASSRHGANNAGEGKEFSVWNRSNATWGGGDGGTRGPGGATCHGPCNRRGRGRGMRRSYLSCIQVPVRERRLSRV